MFNTFIMQVTGLTSVEVNGLGILTVMVIKAATAIYLKHFSKLESKCVLRTFFEGRELTINE